MQTDTIRQKLAYLVELLNEVHAARAVSWTEYQQSSILRRGAERLLQLVIECAADLCAAVVAECSEVESPDSLYECFIQAGVANAVPQPLARQLADWTKIRNRLVHEYDRLDEAAVFGSLAPLEDQFTQCVKHMSDFLQSVADQNASLQPQS